MHMVQPGQLAQAIRRSQAYLLSQQTAEGYWVGELQANTTLTSQYMLFRHLIGRVDEIRQQKCVRYLLSQQQSDGGWPLYYGGPGDLSTTVEAYFALRVAGVHAEKPAMQRARQLILGLGGLTCTHVFTKIFLAMFGQYDWRGVPVIPPEIILLPRGLHFNVYEFSSWSRSVIIPLTVLFAKKPYHVLPPDQHVDDLYVEPPGAARYAIKRRDSGLSWELLFIVLDVLLKISEKYTSQPFRDTALRRIEQWLIEHQDHSGDWGGIMPAMLNSILALQQLGYDLDSPPMAKGLTAIERFGIEEADTFRLQACVSPVWDTVLTVTALADSDIPRTHPAMRQAVKWVVGRQILRDGDWRIKNRHGQPGGWAFEFHNDFYPDIDDTAAVLIALHKAGLPDEEKGDVFQRGLRWLLSMQSDDGGWGAFDINNCNTLLNKIPFADLESMLDPSTCDVTGRVLELLGLIGFPRDHRIVKPALRFMRHKQDADGSWYGRWGVNWIYGTSHVLCGLRYMGEEMQQSYIREAIQWLVEHQNADGGWGESCESYADLAYKGVGTSTASQTAWALIGLLAAGETRHAAVTRGVQFLLRTQTAEGTWYEPEFTGTGFPKYFFIKYHMYQDYFPLMALARYRDSMAAV
ncbi:Squalene--hopene cyclase [Candidatus Entotheonellaceae bacterium PAL068K]